MQKRRSLFITSLILIIISLAILLLSISNLLNSPASIFQTIFSPVRKVFYETIANVSGVTTNKTIEELKKQNRRLAQKIIDQKKLIADNKALSDQFKISNPSSITLIPANIIGASSLIANISSPTDLILEKGEKSGVKVGQAVIYEKNLIGKISKTTDSISKVSLITNSSTSFTSKTLNTNSLGVVKGQGGEEIILDNVLLSDTLKRDDLVLTKGDVNQEGIGLPPDLTVGKITEISKNPSDLFQKASIESLVDFKKLTKVFIITN